MNALRYIPVFFLVSLILYFPGNSMAQQGAGTAGETTLVSAALGEERVISISLPPEYASSGLRYPVLYLLDGRVHEQHANSAVEFLARLFELAAIELGIVETVGDLLLQLRKAKRVQRLHELL